MRFPGGQPAPAERPRADERALRFSLTILLSSPGFFLVKPGSIIFWEGIVSF